MKNEKTISVDGWFGKPEDKTKDEFVKIWTDHASLSSLVIWDSFSNPGSEFNKTKDWADSISDEIKKLAEYNWDYLYKKQNEKKKEVV